MAVHAERYRDRRVAHLAANRRNEASQKLLDATTPEPIFIPVGDPKRKVNSKTAWSHGHPRKETIKRFVAQLSRERETKKIRVSTAPKKFKSMTIKKTIYGTGWDGDIQIIVNSNGTIEDIVTE